jgi:serine-type D-Ala-D-Ala carboxypeptidase (penicillin-binding protein 5/6)
MATLYKRSAKRQIFPKKFPGSVPGVTCESWSVYDPVTKKFLGGKADDQPKEIASISKIMTCLVCLEIADEQNISLNTIVSVPEDAAKIKGTSANLEEADELSLYDLLLGLMLPSGNDSAVALALYFGALYLEEEPMQGFLRVMNYMAEYLDLTSTTFQNPHGLSVKPNYSTAKDVNILTAYALKNCIFKEIVGLQSYVVNVYNPIYGSRQIYWKNTNKLLGKGFDGAKTGTTDKAGACLCATIDDPITPFIVTILKSKTSEDRWEDAIQLAKWARSLVINNTLEI